MHSKPETVLTSSFNFLPESDLVRRNIFIWLLRLESRLADESIEPKSTKSYYSPLRTDKKQTNQINKQTSRM